MAAFRVTREAIFAAADARAAVGEAPTLAGVRGDVGGGSFTTISEAMKEWRAKRAEKSATPTVIREPAPDFVNARIESFAAELWSSVTQKADEKLQTERDAMSQARDDLENQKREAAELADQMEADLQVARDQNEVNTVEIDKLRAQIESISQDLNKEISARSLSESRANTSEAALAESHAALETAKAAVDRAVSDFAAERQARTQAEIDARAKASEVGTLEGRLSAERERTGDLSACLSDVEASHREASTATVRSQVEAASAVAEAARLRSELDAFRAETKAEVASAAEEVGRLRSELEASRVEAKVAGEAAAELRGKLSALVEAKNKPVE